MSLQLSNKVHKNEFKEGDFYFLRAARAIIILPVQVQVEPDVEDHLTALLEHVIQSVVMNPHILFSRNETI